MCALPQSSEQAKLFRLLKPCLVVDVVGERAVAVVRAAGIVDHEIARHRRLGIVVIARGTPAATDRRQNPIRGPASDSKLLSASRDGSPVSRPTRLASAVGRLSTAGAEIAWSHPAAHEAHRLLDRRAAIAQRSPDRKSQAPMFLRNNVGRVVARLAGLRSAASCADADKHGAGEPSRRRQMASRRHAISCKTAHDEIPETRDFAYYRYQRASCQAVPTRDALLSQMNKCSEYEAVETRWFNPSRARHSCRRRSSPRSWCRR